MGGIQLIKKNSNGKQKTFTILLVITISLSLFLFSQPTSLAATVNMGTDSTGGSLAYMNTQVKGNIVTAPATGTLTDIYCSLSVAATTSVIACIYEVSGGAPTTLLESHTANATQTGWCQFSGFSTDITSGNTYFIGVSSQTANVQLYFAAGTHVYGTIDINYPTLPNPAGIYWAQQGGAYDLSIYGVITTTTTPTPTPSPTASPSPSPSPSPTPNPNTRILCLGDSITAGETTGITTPYPATLETLTGRDTLNEGHGGAKISDALYFWDNDKSSPFRDLVLLIGVNDIIFDGANDTTLENGLYTIYTEAMNTYNLDVYGLTIMPFQGWNWNETKQARIETINNWIKTNASAIGVHVVDTYTFFNDPDNNYNLKAIYDSGDHLHPSQEGADAIANLVYQAILAATPTPTPSPSPVIEYPETINISPFWQYLYEGNLLGFVNALFLWDFIVEDIVVGVVCLLALAPLYIRTKSLLLICIIWIILGGFFITAVPALSGLAVIFLVLGVGGLLYRLVKPN